MPRTLRFRPPPVVAPPEVRWMLLRAFGPAGAPFSPPVAPREALAAARRFEVSARVAARQGRARLAAELDEEAALAFQSDQAAAAALGLRVSALAREAAGAAADLEIPLVLLKFAALDASGVRVLGARTVCDLDILAPAGRAAELQTALLGRGYRPSGLPESEHQLPAIVHPSGGVVEVHRRVLGVRPDGGRSATAETLERGGLLLPAPGLPGRCAVPLPEVQAAHILVHGLGQHGWWPDSYPLLRMVADLIDLGFHEEGGVFHRAAALVARDVSPAEAEATRRLCAALAAGGDPLAPDAPPEAGEAVLLRHILAGRLDEGYASALRLGFFRPQPSDRSRAVRLARSILGAVLLTRAQIDAIYGRPRHPLGYLGRRLARPFDLLFRLGIYGARTVRLRLRP